MPILNYNPPWSDDLVELNREEIESAALPIPNMDRELGAGNYGAVYATEDDSVVFKITSDPSEAEFIKRASLLEWPKGIVEYKAVIDFEGEHEDRPTFGIWREAAFNVGLDYTGIEDEDKKQGLHVFATLLKAFQDTARNARYALLHLSDNPSATVEEARGLEDWAGKNPTLYYRMNMTGSHGFDASPAQRLAIALSWGRRELELLATKPYGSHVAEALIYYLDQDIVLADVHTQNVGQVARRNPIWVITDPGHAMFLGDF